MSILSSVAALQGLGRGLFPVHAVLDGRCTCTKVDCSSPGKHPRTSSGVKDATWDPTQISSWERTWSPTNWGFAAGAGVVVIDVDQKSGGYSSLGELDLPETLTSLTGGGGRHLFFLAEGAKNRVNWKQGIDVRADGGYVIVPPGNHISGGSYKWRQDSLADLVALPAWAVEDIASPGAQNGTSGALDLADTANLLHGIPKGSRDDVLFKACCRWRRLHETDADGGYTAVKALALMTSAASNFPAEEALKCVNSAFKQDHRDLWEMPEAEAEVQDEMERRIRERMLSMQIEREARRRIDSADAPAGVGAQDGLLSAILELPEEPDFLVEDLIPYEGNVLISAQMKAGKTTLGLNLAKSLLTGEKFLGAKTVQQIAGRVGFMNYEVSARQFGQWAVKHGIDPQRLYTVNRRGERNPLSYEDSRAELAAQLKAHHVEVLIIDPFLKAFSGADENSASEVDAWLSDMEAFAVEAAIRNLVLIAHAGKTGETTRGSSALEGWPDSIIRLSVNDKTQDRYIKAFGRDVYLEKSKLAFNSETKTLILAGDSFTSSEMEQVANRLDVLNKFGNPPFALSKTTLAKKMPGNYQNNIATAEALIDELQEQGLLIAKTNARGTTYTLTNLPPELLRQAATH